MRLLVLVLFGTGLLLESFGCKLKHDGGKLQGVDDPKKMAGHEYYNSEEIMKKKLVFIYYANDTYAPKYDDFHGNLETLTAVLKLGGGRLLEESMETKSKEEGAIKHRQGTKLIKVADKLRNDFNAFQLAVSRETEILKRFICEYQYRKMSLAIFRNAGNESSIKDDLTGSRQYRWEYCKDEDDGRVTPATMLIQNYRDFRLRAQPLSDLTVFKQALAQVKKVFPPSDHRYILITKAHGSDDMAIMPHVSANMEQLVEKYKSMVKEDPSCVGQNASGSYLCERSKEERAKEKLAKILIADMEKEAGERSKELGDDKNMVPILGLSDVNRALEKRIPNRIGILKDYYFQAISMFTYGDPVRKGMYFPVVFMESCKSSLEFDKKLASVLRVNVGDPNSQIDHKKLDVKNVGLLYTSDKEGLGYHTIDYPYLFEDWRMRQIPDFQQVLTSHMDTLSSLK